jgi:DNA-binding transcriptional LysR family regulator
MLSDLVGQQWALASDEMQRELCAVFEERDLPRPDVALRSTSSMLRVSKVATSRLLGLHSVATLLSLTYVQPWLSILPVKDFVWSRPVLAVYKSARSISPAARRFMEDMKAIAKQLE